MGDDTELSLTLTVKVRTDGVEHDLNVISSGYTSKQDSDVRQVINEDVKFLVEDLVRRVWKVGRDD